MARATPPKGGSDLNRYRELISRLEESRGKMRKRGDNTNSRSYDQRSDQRRAEYERGLAEYRANQDRYRGDFELVGGGNPNMAYSQVVTGYYNPKTGATWSAPHSGWKPKEGTGWVKGYGLRDAVKDVAVRAELSSGRDSSGGGSLAGPTSPDWKSLKGDALVQARKEHQAKLDERSAKLHSVMKDF